MTVLETGASSHNEVNWNDINWRAVNGNALRLQARIVKATREGRWGKVKALQWLLTHSFSGKALAVRRVTENQGRRTAGIDGETWPKPQQRAAAISALKRRGYRAKPLRRIYIPKRNGRKRPLSIPTMADRAQQALHLLALDPIAETLSDGNSYGFRKQRSTADAIAQCFNVFSRKSSPEWVLECDIKSCFDEISHEWMTDNIPIDKVILKQWLKAGYIEKQSRQATVKGLAQGGIISPTIMNITLNGLEEELREKFPQYYYKHNKVQVNLVRYADDLIISGSSREVLVERVKPLAEAFLNKRGLELSIEKTKITNIAEGFDFLGQNIRKYDGKLLITPAKENVKTFLRKVRGIIKSHKQLSAGKLIEMLNPRIKGWANYHRHIASKRVFTQVDSAIHQALWQWARRRHSNKSREWVMKKYFKTVGGDHWVFFGETAAKEKQTREISLFNAASVQILRHTKIKASANPYDLEWESYFEQRIAEQMRSSLQGKWKLMKLWFGQRGVCPVCRQKITKQTGWNMHHLVWRSRGGGEGSDNLVLLHPLCHSQVHNSDLSTAMPDLEKGLRKA